MGSDDRLHVLGIRHHGPGSAASVVRALQALDPERVLIEGPPECTEILPFVLRRMRPPIAMLVHLADEPAIASFYPFASWSPEYQAMRWALARQKPVELIDLPIAIELRKRQEERKAYEAWLAELAAAEEQDGQDEEASEGDSAHEDETPPGGEHEEDALVEDGEDAPVDPSRDPLGALARLDGYDDGEAWWNEMVEEADGDPALFAHIEEAMGALREGLEIPGERGEREARREAHMRLRIREALKDTEGPVVVVVGAWHAPAVRPSVSTIKADKALLSGLKKAKVTSTWVPWTDSRLAAASGYGAGVRHPGWYRMLWQDRNQQTLSATELATRWQVRVARALRERGQDGAVSRVIDAVQLVLTLSAVRERGRPGLAELRDATLATLCGGDPSLWRLVEEDVLVGDAVGVVPDDVPQMPLAVDLARQQRKLKLKPSGLEKELSLDLRSQSGGARSVLLHRLNRIGVAWGKLADAGRSRGTFRENWTVCWDPEQAVQLAEALQWGTTIAEAANQKVVVDMDATGRVGDLAGLVRGALLADLGPAATHGVRRLQKVAADGNDVAALCETVPPLVDVLRYGTARELPEAGIESLVHELVERVVLGLHYAVRDLDADAAGLVHRAMASFDRAVHRFQDGARLPEWHQALERVATDTESTPVLAGFATRRLRDEGVWDDDEVARHLAMSLSPGFPLARAAGWLEGFLGDAAVVLLHDPRLLGLVDTWLLSLDQESLLEALPLFRRATSGFTDFDRQRLLGLVSGARAGASSERVTTTVAFQAGQALLDTVLGLSQEAS